MDWIYLDIAVYMDIFLFLSNERYIYINNNNVYLCICNQENDRFLMFKRGFNIPGVSMLWWYCHEKIYNLYIYTFFPLLVTMYDTQKKLNNLLQPPIGGRVV